MGNPARAVTAWRSGAFGALLGLQQGFDIFQFGWMNVGDGQPLLDQRQIDVRAILGKEMGEQPAVFIARRHARLEADFFFDRLFQPAPRRIPARFAYR